MKKGYRQFDKDMAVVVVGFVFTAILMYLRAFKGVEIRDEAYYVAEAKAVLDGNFPYIYNTGAANGFGLFLSLLVAVYRWFVPNEEGLFLFTRLCFVTYKVWVSFVIFVVLQKKIKRSYALLLVCIILPMHGWIQNFSYNSVPILNNLLAGILLYDAIEQEATQRKYEIIFSGFLTAISCWSNLGWGITAVIFLSLLLFRLPKEERKDSLRFFLLGGGGALFVILFPIILQTGLEDFRQGLWRTIFSPIPVDYIGIDLGWATIKKYVGIHLYLWIKIFFISATISYFIFLRFVHENGKKLEKETCLLLALATAMTIHIFYIGYTIFMDPKCTEHSGMFGLTALCDMCIFACAGLFRKESIVYYAGIHPLVYTLMVIYYTGTFGLFRFENCHFLFLVILYALFKCRKNLIHIMAILSSIALTGSMVLLGINSYISEDSPYRLTEKVSFGVYKGIYTSQMRATDIAEMENYLNRIIGENETYAFRDNVPCGYVMVHKGKMCDICTWDIMFYYRHANSPAKLFDYYKRRRMIPDKIIYINYGMYDTFNKEYPLSIDNPNFRYNDWVNAYYDLVEDIELNEMFKRVKVYQYNGKFDGNYQYWIDTYWQPTKPKKNSLF